MHKTHSKMHMHDLIKIDKIVFEVVRGRLLTPPPPPPPGPLTVSNIQHRIGLKELCHMTDTS